MSGRDVYESTVRQLSAVERLRLASLILNDLAGSSGEGLDVKDHWTDEDIADLAKFSLKDKPV